MNFSRKVELTWPEAAKIMSGASVFLPLGVTHSSFANI